MGRKSGSRAASNKAIDELIEFCNQDPWRERMGEVLDFHMLPVCEKMGMLPDDLARMLGEQASSTF
ncbi:MAG: hypothetical protein HQL50_15325 [Magnetococcales bacterium]|nr:hypothetical protein [Magnetococcales bacterium]